MSLLEAAGDDGVETLRRGWTDGLGPDPDLSVAAWSDRYRILSPRGANEAGPWRTSRTPYLQELLDGHCHGNVGMCRCGG